MFALINPVLLHSACIFKKQTNKQLSSSWLIFFSQDPAFLVLKIAWLIYPPQKNPPVLLLQSPWANINNTAMAVGSWIRKFY